MCGWVWVCWYDELTQFESTVHLWWVDVGLEVCVGGYWWIWVAMGGWFDLIAGKENDH